ncbi:type II toxin-antitoxin system death-on-curing family toxin [Paracoccus fontiphilus]|uniref:Type II toxin-antitoxin system death-on-curing family toxin n=1 Tax=Paracoccus fontiphilus TaxID=1815556 RepID=A0ABV7INC6_9RHOB
MRTHAALGDLRPERAGSSAYGIAKAHGFVDGNKRTAFVTALTFLRLNGLGFRPDPVQGGRMMDDLASNDVTKAAFAAWLAVGMEGL